MKHQRQASIALAASARTRAIAAEAEAEYDVRRMELTFLMMATLVFIVTTGLVIGFHFR